MADSSASKNPELPRNPLRLSELLPKRVPVHTATGDFYARQVSVADLKRLQELGFGAEKRKEEVDLCSLGRWALETLIVRDNDDGVEP